MTRHRRAALGLAGVAVLVIGGLFLTIQPLAGDVCVTQYEDASQGGDSLTTCSTTPSLVKIANLSTVTTGLHNGCNRVLNTSSSWNDCISSARVTALPAAQSVHWYRDSAYGSQVHCVDGNGTYNVNLPGGAIDVISSFRILGGNCP